VTFFKGAVYYLICANIYHSHSNLSTSLHSCSSYSTRFAVFQPSTHTPLFVISQPSTSHSLRKTFTYSRYDIHPRQPAKRKMTFMILLMLTTTTTTTITTSRQTIQVN
jgi:hypothetical protein